MTTQRRNLLVLAAGLCGAGVALWLALGEGGDTPPTGPPLSGDEAPRTQAPPEAPRPELAARLAAEALSGRYTLSYGLEMDVTAGGLEGLAGSNRLALDATVELAPLADRPWLLGRFTAVAVTGDQALVTRAGIDPEAVGDAAYKVFALRFGADGAVVERRYDPALPAGVRNILGTLVAGLQVVRPPGAGQAPRWTVEEQGLDGPIQATYALKGGTAVKTWSREVGAGERTPEEPAHVVTAGRATSTRTAAGALVTVAFTQQMRGDFGLDDTAPLELTSATRADLERLGDAPGAWTKTVDVDALVSDVALAEASHRAGADRLPDPRGQGPQALLAASEAAHQAKDRAARRHAMKQLAATLRTDPGALDLVNTRLRADDVSPNGLRTLVEAVTLADTPEAHATMETLMRDPDAPDGARHAMTVATGLMAEPSERLMDTLSDLARGTMDEVGVAALLGIGIQGNPSRRGPHLARAREELLARAEERIAGGADADADADDNLAPNQPAAQPTRISAWLDALGNMGGPEVWPLIAPYMTHPDEWIRHSAVGALYYVELTEARLALGERIASDTSQYVRREALRTAANHPQRVFEAAIIRALQQDEAPSVRLEAAAALAAWGIDSPALYPVIAAAAERENHREVRRMMEDLMPEDLTQPGDLDEPDPGRLPSLPDDLGGAP